MWFRYSANRVQWLAAVSGGTVRFYGHQPTGSIPHGGFGGMLRPWPIR